MGSLFPQRNKNASLKKIGNTVSTIVHKPPTCAWMSTTPTVCRMNLSFPEYVLKKFHRSLIINACICEKALKVCAEIQNWCQKFFKQHIPDSSFKSCTIVFQLNFY